MATLAKLDEAMAIQADVRDVAADRLIDEGLRGRPEGEALGEADQALERLRQVERVGRVIGCDEMVHEVDGDLSRLNADLLLAELVDHVVSTDPAGRAGLAVPDFGAGEVLELKGDVLGDVAGPRALVQAGDESTAAPERAGMLLEGRHQLDESIDEARDRVRRE